MQCPTRPSKMRTAWKLVTTCRCQHPFPHRQAEGSTARILMHAGQPRLRSCNTFHESRRGHQALDLSGTTFHL
eukprot:4081533-Alexandrium_andersonii.AAC.1